MDDLAQMLPDDVLAGILRRLAPRSLAVSRCVCKAWRAMVDARRLLHADLLPLSLGGIFVTPNGPGPSEFLYRPSTPARRIAGKLDYVNTPGDNWNSLSVEDHCNGLVLLDNHVVNPATQQWTRLPPRLPPRMEWETFRKEDDGCLVFDPTVSPHYEVFLFHYVYYGRELDPAIDRLEWPPSPYILRVFSSRTRRWEERQFVREGEAAGTVADMRFAADSLGHRYTVYRSGTLYVHCQNNVIMRITLSNDKYQVVRLPEGAEVDEFSKLYLGKSKEGVYCALLDWCMLRVWFLDESCSQMEWVLKFNTDLQPLMADLVGRFDNQPWILDVDDGVYSSEALVQEKFEWDSDNDDFLATEDRIEKHYKGSLSLLGFHPHKEVVFLHQSNTRVLAYHLNSSKVQYLGKIRIKYRGDFIFMAFPYTPCWMRDLSHDN